MNAHNTRDVPSVPAQGPCASDPARPLTLGSVITAATAGAVAVWVMDRFDWFAFDHVNPHARQGTEAARPGGMDPAHALAAKAAAAVGSPLEPAPPHQHPAGLAVHYLVPMALAVVYERLRSRLPLSGSAKGALYGAGTFVILDEIINPLLGLAAAPYRYPWQRHVRELASHMIYGAVTDRVLLRLTAWKAHDPLRPGGVAYA